MARSYKKLWHKLIDLNMTRGELRRKAGISTNALAHLGKDESVPISTLEKICGVLACPIEEIVEVFPDGISERHDAETENEQ